MSNEIDRKIKNPITDHILMALSVKKSIGYFFSSSKGGMRNETSRGLLYAQTAYPVPSNDAVSKNIFNKTSLLILFVSPQEYLAACGEDELRLETNNPSPILPLFFESTSVVILPKTVLLRSACAE